MKRFSKLLISVATPADFVARLNGDEFAFLCSDNTAAERLVANLQLALAEPLSVGERVLNAAASIGTASASVADSSESLMAAADAALYPALFTSLPARPLPTRFEV